MMWNVMTYGGPTISLSASDAAGAAVQFAMTHGMPGDVKLESYDGSCSLFSSGGVPIVVSRGPICLEEVHRESLALHDKLGLESDESFEIILGVLEKIAGDPDYKNYN
jgi:hypothetical protein